MPSAPGPSLIIQLDDDRTTQWTFEDATHSIEPAINRLSAPNPNSGEPVVRVWTGSGDLMAVFPLRCVKAIHVAPPA